MLEAVIELVEETGEMPIAQQIADRSGMSIRSVFRLYEDVNDLQASAVRLRVTQLRGRYTVPDSAVPLDERLDELVATWTEVHESITPVRRVIVGLLDRSEPLREQYFAGMRYLSDQLEVVFAPELAELKPTDRQRRLAALDVALSWETWHRLRSTRALSTSEARAVVRLSVDALLGV